MTRHTIIGMLVLSMEMSGNFIVAMLFLMRVCNPRKYKNNKIYSQKNLRYKRAIIFQGKTHETAKVTIKRR